REVWNELLGHTNTSTRVSRKINSRDTHLSSLLCAFEEKLVFLRTEGPDSESYIVGNDNVLASTRILWSLSSEQPTNNTMGVGSWLTLNLGKISIIVQDKFNIL